METERQQRAAATAWEELRQRAEELVRSGEKELPSSREEIDTQRLLHELQVHQIELEMQNAELLRTQEEMEWSQKRYTDLYNLAPLGYFTLNPRGVILDTNIAGEVLFGMSKNRMVDKPFADFLSDESRKAFSRHLQRAAHSRTAEDCEVRFQQSEGGHKIGIAHSIAVGTAETGDSFILTAIVDDTVRKHGDEVLQTEHDQLEQLVTERTTALKGANIHLTRLLDEQKRTEADLRQALLEVKRLKERLEDENIYLQKEVERKYNLDEIVGQSPTLSQMFDQIEQVAPQDTTVLLLGETGTGKGLMARALHRRSGRKERPLITVDCTALPANLIESELFGREKGAFTGATGRQVGRFDLAQGGTIFLDEIGEMPLELQSKLLRVIQHGEFERLGSPTTVKVDVRIIAASNRDLKEEVRAGRFRKDLFYRLNVFPITIPPLRQRVEDIPLLVEHFVAKFNKKLGRNIETVSSATLNALREYPWPGNVRELESAIERAVITSPGNDLRVLDTLDALPGGGGLDSPEIKPLADAERDHILQALRQTGGRVEGARGAAALLGINPSTLRARMRKHGISRQQGGGLATSRSESTPSA